MTETVARRAEHGGTLSHGVRMTPAADGDLSGTGLRCFAPDNARNIHARQERPMTGDEALVMTLNAMGQGTRGSKLALSRLQVPSMPAVSDEDPGA